MKRATVFLSAAAVLSMAGPLAAATTTLERELTFDPATVRIVRSGETAEVLVPGTMREFRAGLPDLPWRTERIELPIGVRVRGLEVLSLETRPLGESGRLESAIRPTPGLEKVERTAPDPAVFSHRGFLPETVAELGVQGFQRGTNVALVQWSPVRWDPASGRLEAVTRVRLRLELEPSAERPLARERMDLEWDRPRGAAARRLAAAPAGKRGPERFQATQLPSVMGSPVEYVIITNEEMQAEFQRLADWKTQSGVPAVVRTLSFIRQEYQSAADDPERIRDFIRDAYSRWGTKWVLLAGDTDVLPARFGYSVFYSSYIASDLYYQALDGNWNADGDHLFGEGYYSQSNPGDAADLLPEVFVGRAPCLTAAQAQLFVNKTLMYEKTPVTDYLNTVLLFAEVLFPQDWVYPQETTLDGAQLAETVLPYLQQNPNIHYVRLYENYTNPAWKPGALLETRQAVLDSLARGYNIAVHIGHGYRNVMHVGDGALENSDAFTLDNGNRLINVYAINCTSNAIDFPSIGEAFLLSPTGGAVTNIGSTNFDFPSAGQVYEDEYFRLVFDDSTSAVGEAHALAKLPWVGYSVYDGVNRWTQMTLLLLGDPELRLFTGPARTLSVTHPASMAASDTSLLVHVAIGSTALYGARVTAYKPGADYSVKTTDGAGNVTMPFRPDSAGSFTLTVTGFDCVPYQAAVTLLPPTPPVLDAMVPAIDDDASGGSSGNGDGIVDAGETVDLVIPVRNNGGSSAPTVNGTLTTTDPAVSIPVATRSYGTLAAGGQASPTPGFRIVVAASAGDQREVPFEMVLVDGNGKSYRQRFQLVVRGPEYEHLSHSLLDQGGNSNGRPDPGETVIYYIRLRNIGTGAARSVTGKLRNPGGGATVLDSVATWGDIAPDQDVQADALVFSVSDAAAILELEISDSHGVESTQRIDLVYPSVPQSVLGVGRATSIDLQWAPNAEPDLLGYYCYRANTQNGAYTKINPVPTGRISAYADAGLAPLTKYYYKVSAVDSSGNESSLSPASAASTNPPPHTIFPVPMGRETAGAVAIDHVYPGYPVAIAAGADVLYVVHPDGQAPVDADDAGSSHGDFTRRGSYYASGPSISDLDGGGPEIIGLSWGTQPDPGATDGDSMMVCVFDPEGQMKPGWPKPTLFSMWSGAACGDVDGDGIKEIVFGSNGTAIYAFHANGTELIDGDANPATVGVFKTLPGYYNFGTPAIADLDGDQVNDIVFGSFDAQLHAWRGNGTSIPGFPIQLNGTISCSPAVGFLDGPSDNQLDIAVVTTAESAYVFRANGARRSGFPKWMKFGASARSPSPALADMNNDGFLDVVLASTNGGIFVLDRNGNTVPPWSNLRYSTLASGASQSSPVVADINGDGLNDVVMGDELGQLSAISGTGTMLPGFPIVLAAEARGPAALCDCDADGMTEIAVAGWDRHLYMWDYDFPFSPGKTPPWPQFHHDAARTGFASNPAFVDVEDPLFPWQRTAALELSAPSPNPARASAVATYSVPAAMAGAPFEVAVYDVSGRRLRTLDRGTARVGQFAVAWDLRGANGRTVGEGLYFLRVTLGSQVQARKVAVIH